MKPIQIDLSSGGENEWDRLEVQRPESGGSTAQVQKQPPATYGSKVKGWFIPDWVLSLFPHSSSMLHLPLEKESETGDCSGGADYI